MQSAAVELPGECKASAALSTAIQAAPSASVFDATGTWFSDHGKPQCAMAAFSGAVRLAPQSAESHYDLGLVLSQLKQLPPAADEFRLALKYDPGMLQARNDLGTVLAELGRNDEALAEFQEVLNSDSNSVYALDHSGQLLASGHRYTAAISYWKRALAIQPDSPEIMRSMGVAFWEDGKLSESVAVLTAITKPHPDMKSAHFSLAAAFTPKNSIFRRQRPNIR